MHAPKDIGDLPVELISLIFMHCRTSVTLKIDAYRNGEDTVELTWINRQLRAIAHSTPELWARFKIAVDKPGNLAYLLLALRLSAPLPLSVTLSLGAEVEPLVRTSYIIGLLAAHSHGWKAVEFNMSSIFMSYYTRDGCAPPSLYLAGAVEHEGCSPPLDVGSIQAPQLHDVVIDTSQFDLAIKVKLPWEQLVSLALDINWFETGDTSKCIGELNKLETLHIVVTDDGWERLPSKRDFKRLKSLIVDIVDGRPFGETIQLWELPALEKLELRMSVLQMFLAPVVASVGMILQLCKKNNQEPLSLTIQQSEGPIGGHVWQLLTKARRHVRNIAFVSAPPDDESESIDEGIVPSYRYDVALEDLEELTIGGPISPLFLRRILFPPEGHSQMTPALRKLVWHTDSRVEYGAVDAIRQFMVQQRPDVTLQVVAP